MNIDFVPSRISVLASLSTQCSGSSKASGLTNSWPPPAWAFSLVALAAFPAAVSAAPLGANISVNGLHRRDDSGSNSSNTSISMSVWLPILIVTVVFVFFSFCTCIRRCAANDTATAAAGNRAPAAASGNTATTVRPRRRPQRTPSQISTKSLPPYMKEPGDQELVLFRGPEERDDDHELHHAMPILPEDDEEHHDMGNGTYDIALGRIESVDTIPDSSTTNLIGRASVSLPRPPELHHATVPRGHHRTGDGHSLDSAGSEAELLAGHQRAISVDHPDPRGEAPSYTEAVEGRMATISLNDPDANNTSVDPVVPPPSHTADAVAGRGYSRFNFLKHNPFSSHNNTSNGPSNVRPPSSIARSESPALHTGSALSRFSSRESHDSHQSRAPSRNNNLSRTHTRSNSNLFRAFHSHSHSQGFAGSSTISVDSISAPLTHTATHAEFHIPKGGFLTPEQVKLITSREALEKFGVPYGPDAVAAFSLSRERLAQMGPPPEFESLPGGNGATESVVEATAQGSGTSESDTPPSHSTSHQPDVHAESCESTDMAHELDEDGQPCRAQTVQVHASGDEGADGADEPCTARPPVPRTIH